MTLRSVRTAKREDLYFIIPSIFVWFSSISVTTWDFMRLQGNQFILSLTNIAGLILFLSGLSIRFTGKRTLNENYSWTIDIREGHQLIKHGIYKHIHHPIYLGAIMYTLGIPVFFSSLYGFLIMMGMIPLLVYRMGIEERMLIEKLGDDYKKYINNTKRLIPFIY
jgi:protein-S-isoprenylcysteine O-methyltransferase Ste14